MTAKRIGDLAAARHARLGVGGIRAAGASPEDLVQTKRAVARRKDLIDVEHVVALRDEIEQGRA